MQKLLRTSGSIIAALVVTLPVAAFAQDGAEDASGAAASSAVQR